MAPIPNGYIYLAQAYICTCVYGRTQLYIYALSLVAGTSRAPRKPAGSLHVRSRKSLLSKMVIEESFTIVDHATIVNGH
jgi:hypothetical protein